MIIEDVPISTEVIKMEGGGERNGGGAKEIEGGESNGGGINGRGGCIDSKITKISCPMWTKKCNNLHPMG